MKLPLKIICLAFVFLSLQVFAEDSAMSAPSIPKNFEPLKQLLGTWEGKHRVGEEEMPVKVTYALTSAGTAITETLMAGTPQEMVSMYHKDGDSVAMTHYCMLGNQPHMQMTKSSKNEMVFEMQSPKAGLVSANEAHMHGVTLKLIDNNTLEQSWKYFVDGKEQSTEVFTFKRKI